MEQSTKVGRMLRISDIKEHSVKCLYEDVLHKCELRDECWYWTGAMAQRGNYPVIKRWNKTMAVKRYVYEKLNGFLGAGVTIINTAQCEYPNQCVNPKHLYTRKLKRGGFRSKTFGLPIR